MSVAHVGQNGFDNVSSPPKHRESEYDSAGFDVLLRMQRDHFWYRGRHRFIRHSVRRFVRRFGLAEVGLDVIDLGGGCGGWISYCERHRLLPDANWALADSSPKALELAKPMIGANVRRYHVDLLDLAWQDRWDIAFLLDVLEHIPDHEQAIRQIYRALRPGGLLFVTTPALSCFWSWNDDIAGHQRRYSKADFRRLAPLCGFELSDTRYFMFFLSPLLLAARWTRRPDIDRIAREAIANLQARSHRVPHPVINGLLAAMFNMETPLGQVVPFPWGTSILAVLRKPSSGNYA
jgi:2-polyprenyl-3-methyl-5-hydroxy-6-metoxy-1,4-benzoquinol methylase